MQPDVNLPRLGHALGWLFDRCGRVDVFGQAVLAFAQQRADTDATGHWLPAPSLVLTGVVVTGEGDVRSRLEAASEFAGYCPRALLLGPDERVHADLRAWLAMLDVGLVTADLTLLAPAGPRVAGARFSYAEWELLERVEAGLSLPAQSATLA